jgi:nitroreductase
MLHLLNQHRSIRKYTNMPISEELLASLLQASTRTSNTGNMQAYSIIVTRDRTIKEQLAPAHFNQSMVMQAPVLLTFCADFNRVTKWCKLRNAQAGFNNFQSFMAAAIDAMLAAQTLAIAAESVGLGICYLGTTTYNARPIIDALQLPHLVVPITTITLGYPDGDSSQTDRLPGEAVVHYETYQDFTSSSIAELYAEKENSDFYKQFVADNKKDTLAQVFTDIRYTKANNEFFSEKFIEVLKEQGFM